jgi:putative tryptophan/tyrosine transport system substrate-binding protein
VRRRTFIAGLGSAAVWPVVARGQQAGLVRHIAVLTSSDENDPKAKGDLTAFLKGLAELGWIDGHNVHIDYRWTAGSAERAPIFAKELADQQPDVILAESTPQTAALQRETRSIPIVFVGVSDPVGSGFVTNLRRPGGNITGFGWMEPTMGGKWLELLVEIPPSVKRVAAVFNPESAPYVPSYYLPSLEAAARSLKVDTFLAPVHDDVEIKSVIASLGHEPGGGLIAMSDGFLVVHRTTIITATAQHNVPAIYFSNRFVTDGGLLSYSGDLRDHFRRAATYIDRILRGAKPSDLPVQLPVKFQTVVNAKTAKALGLTVPQSILLRADEVIE